MSSVRVRAPASSANLGPGFDSLALALDIWLQVTVELDGGDGVRAAGEVELLGGDNLVVEAMRRAADEFGFALPGCAVSVESEIPVARGLGSSAAAIVAGIRAASELAGHELDESEIIDLAAAMEGHADNVAAATLGGAAVAVAGDSSFTAVRLARTFQWRPVLFIPDNASLTTEARNLLPREVPLADAVANAGRAALLVYALTTGRGDLLRVAMVDRLHQPYRESIFPHLKPVIDGALEAGADGACLSGAGPTILALVEEGLVHGVADAMEQAAAGVGIAGTLKFPAVARRGVELLARPRLSPSE